jgi:hypothetical protein
VRVSFEACAISRQSITFTTPATRSRMHPKIQKIKQFRVFLLKQLQGITCEQLNFIPANYSNNIIWNLGHMIAAQQNMCYVKASRPVAVADEFFTPYLSGTKPDGIAREEHIEALCKIFITSIDQLQTDYDSNVFAQYAPPVMISKVYGFDVNNIDEALEYILYHEGLHAGQILSLKRMLQTHDKRTNEDARGQI